MDGSISELSSEKIIEDSGPENETNLSLYKNIFEQRINIYSTVTNKIFHNF